MKEFEKYTLSVLSGAIIFNLLSINIYLMLIVFLGTFIFTLKYKKKFYFVLFVSVIIIGNFRTWNEEYKIGETYKIIIAGDKTIEIKSINGKLPKNKIYLKNSFIENNTGFFQGKIILKKNQKFHNITYIEGEIIEFVPSHLNRYKTKLRNIIERTGYSFEVESFVKAIVLGERGELHPQLEENYRKVGASHILSISGLHISIVIVAFLTLFHYFSFNYRLKYGLTLIVLSGYVLILGNNPAVIRSYLMGFIYLLSKLFYEKAELKKSFCISIIAVLLINPNTLKDLSFLMSYGALFGIIYVFEKFKRKNIYINILLFSLLIQIVLSPITVYYFKTLAIYTFIFNIFIVFWGDLLINLIFIGIFLESIKLGFIIRFLVEFFYEVLDVFIKSCAKLPYSSFNIEKKMTFYFFILMILFVISLLKYRVFSIYFLMSLFLAYNFLPDETLINKNFVYFPKYKTLVFISENKGEDIKKYLEKSTLIIIPEHIKNSIKNKEVLILKKGEKIEIDEFIFENEENKRLVY